MSDRNDPNYLLAPENHRELNEAFYKTEPFEYFNQRLDAALLVAAKGPELDGILAGGVRVGTLHRTGENHPAGSLQAAERQERRDRYVVAEAEVLLHHAAETLLRLYLSHETLPPCPWLAIAKETNPRAFKERVQSLRNELSSGERRDQLAAVFFGASERTKLTPPPAEDEWDAGLKNVAMWLDWFAGHFLDSNVYNAAKHGLALRPGDAAFSLGGSSDDQILAASGPALEFIETIKDDSGRRRWQRTTQWIDVDRTLAHVYFACRMMRGLWAIASARYTGASLTSIDRFINPRFADAHGEGIVTTSLSIPLTYYAERA